MEFNLNDVKRFFAFVNRGKKLSDCWEWISSKNKEGYGDFWLNGKRVAAHRFSFFLHNGVLPKDKLICHTCDNPSCVNPEHLWAGSNKQNIIDSLQKRRWPKAKITFEQARRIRELNKEGKTQSHLAARFGITQSRISDIINDKTWKEYEVN